MMLSGADLVAVSKRQVVLSNPDEAKVGPNSIILVGYDIQPASKPGVYIMKAKTTISSPSHMMMYQFAAGLWTLAELSAPTILPPGVTHELSVFIRPIEKVTMSEILDMVPTFGNVYVFDGKMRT